MGAALVLLALLAAVLIFKPGGGRPRFEEGDFLVCAGNGGKVELYWPEASGSALYQVDIRYGETHETQYCGHPYLELSGVFGGEELHIRIQAVANRESLLGKSEQIKSWKTLKADLILPKDGELSAPVLTDSGDSGTIRWTGEGEIYEVFRSNKLSTPGGVSGVLIASTKGTEWAPLEEEGDDFQQFAVRAGWPQKGFILCGPASTSVMARGSDLPDLSSGPITLDCQETETRMYTLEWNGVSCAGGRMEVQEWREDRWETIAWMHLAERMRYDTGRLRSGSSHRFRVAAIDINGYASGETAEISLTASISPLHSTVWPIQDLTLYENPGKGERLASVPGGTALCVLAEEGDWFRVRYREEYGWVDSRFCMIDLPEYVGDYCDYNITNSYESLFAAHNASIKQITGEVISGFENIQTADGRFLVPYLYPCAKKLLTAAQNAQADGYKLKIYEAFRPQQATRFLYDTTDAQKNDAVVTETGERTTLFKLMTDNGRFALGSFLARTISAHNRGIALDLTLEKIDSGEELEMQSQIHDLSWYAATDRNNDSARLLAKYMTGVGMNGLSSEWWHFQDDATKASIGLNTSLYKGVSPEGWTQDDAGWRYRNADGSFTRNTAVTIDGRSYVFDYDGYVVG